VLIGVPVFGWGPEGHHIVARIAARNLTLKARVQIASLLVCDPDPFSVEEAMAVASYWADTIDKKLTRTGEWHYIDIALTDSRSDMAKRCPKGACITEKIPELMLGIKTNHVGDWSVGDQLKFVIHLVGDLHQPLHCADNADRGGNCVQTHSLNAKNLHMAWDIGMVGELGTDEVGLANQLAQHADSGWKQGAVDDWAWESHQVALRKVYGPLSGILPKEPPMALASCDVAPAAIRNAMVTLSRHYVETNQPVVREQLAKAGIRLASLLNSLWQ
jgi:hypothetical protein